MATDKLIKYASKLAGQYKFLYENTQKWYLYDQSLDINIQRGLELCEQIKQEIEKIYE